MGVDWVWGYESFSWVAAGVWCWGMTGEDWGRLECWGSCCCEWGTVLEAWESDEICCFAGILGLKEQLTFRFLALALESVSRNGWSMSLLDRSWLASGVSADAVWSLTESESSSLLLMLTPSWCPFLLMVSWNVPRVIFLDRGAEELMWSGKINFYIWVRNFKKAIQKKELMVESTEASLAKNLNLLNIAFRVVLWIAFFILPLPWHVTLTKSSFRNNSDRRALTPAFVAAWASYNINRKHIGAPEHNMEDDEIQDRCSSKN